MPTRRWCRTQNARTAANPAAQPAFERAAALPWRTAGARLALEDEPEELRFEDLVGRAEPTDLQRYATKLGVPHLGEVLEDRYARLKADVAKFRALDGRGRRVVAAETALERADAALADMRTLDSSPKPLQKFKRLFTALGMDYELDAFGRPKDQLLPSGKRIPKDWKVFDPKEYRSGNYKGGVLKISDVKPDWMTLRGVSVVLQAPELNEELRDAFVKLESAPEHMRQPAVERPAYAAEALAAEERLQEAKDILQEIRDREKAGDAQVYSYPKLERLFDLLEMPRALNPALVALTERLCAQRGVPAVPQKIVHAFEDKDHAEAAINAVLQAAAGHVDVALVADALGFVGAPRPWALAAKTNAEEILTPVLGATLAAEAAAHIGSNWRAAAPLLASLRANGEGTRLRDLHELAKVLKVESWAGRAVGEMIVEGIRSGPLGSQFEERAGDAIRAAAAALPVAELLESPGFAESLAHLEREMLDREAVEQSVRTLFKCLGLDDTLPWSAA